MLKHAIPLALVVSVSACGGGSSPPTNAATPTPTPTPTITLVSASPAPGSTVSAGRNDPVTLRLRVTSPTSFCIGQTARIPADTPQEFVISVGAGTTSRTCPYPRVVDRAAVCFTEYTGLELRLPDLPISYTFIDP